MIKFWQKRAELGILTEDVAVEEELKAIQKEIKEQVKRKFAGSLAIRMVDS